MRLAVIRHQTSMPSGARPPLGGLRLRLTSLLAVVMLTAATPGFFPLVVGGIAALDEDHRVFLCGAGEDTDVILNHGAPGVDAARHHHCAVAKVLVLFSQPAPGGPDHVLHFATGGKFLNGNPALVSLPDAFVSEPVFQEISLASLAFFPIPSATSSPPAPPGALGGVRTTLLLI
jgi:hypothetical protein